MNELELTLLDWIQTHLTGTLGNAAMPFVTHLGDGGMIWIGSAAVLILIPKTRKLGTAIAVGLAMEAICCNGILKPLVARVRPCELNSAVPILIPHPTDFSFPSGHTGASFAAASALYFGGSKLYIPAAILAVLIGFSRLYLYVHYPTDVLAGFLLGMMFGWVGSTLCSGNGRAKGVRCPPILFTGGKRT